MKAATVRIKRCPWARTELSKWMVDGLRGEDGKRVRRFFKSREAAQEWLSEKRPELKSQGQSALVLTDSARVDAQRALAILQPYGATLTQAANAFAERARMLSRTVTISALIAELLAAKKADGASERYLGDLKHRIGAFAQSFGDRPTSSIETREIDDWLRGLSLSPVSRNNFRRNLGVAFSYAVRRGYAQENPAVGSSEAKETSEAPGYLKPFEMAALLATAPSVIVPSLAIAGFAGLREAELSRLDWSDIDLEQRHITIDGAKAKTGSRRLVPISDNLQSWLTPIAQKAGSIHMMNFHQKLREVRKRAVLHLREKNLPTKNLEDWPHNALRHSFVSYRLALTADVARVAIEAGHSAAILHRHYKALVSQSEAQVWFSINRTLAGTDSPST